MSDVRRVRVGVVGTGHLGKHHVRILSDLPEADLAGIADPEPDRLRELSAKYGVRGYADYRHLADIVDAVCVVVPTHLHREIAGFFLEQGIDVLVEKPITPKEAEGRELVHLARERKLILQVGHVERFNSALKAIADLGMAPRYIESHRLAPFTFRSMDIGVVLDLMIHDLDLVLSMVDSKIRAVDAFGGSVFSSTEDMASGILKFENGAVAHLTANRVAMKPMRRMRMFSPDCYISLDFHTAHGLVIRKNPGVDFKKLDLSAVDTSQIDDLWKYVFEGLLTVKEYQLDEGNPLASEIGSFLAAVRDRSEPEVTGEAGCEAVAVAHRVLKAIGENRW